MGGYTGKYSRNPFSTFDEEKNYAFSLLQEGVPVTDDDWNANSLALLTRARRGNQLFGDYGTPNDGFRIQEATSNVNNFKITGGGPANTDIEESGRFFMRGYSCLLLKDVDYINALSNLSQQSIHPRVTRVYYDGTNTVVEDSAAQWATDELRTLTTGRKVVINTITYDIDSNSSDAMKLLPLGVDHTSAISDGDFYRLTLTTPSSNREDAVYLNVYVDEYDGNDDPDINKRIGGEEIEAMLQAKIIQALFVREDVPTNGELTDYTDSDGNQHFVFKLATLNRTATSAITTAMIVDLVPTIGFTTIGQDQLSMLRPRVTSPITDKVFVSPGQVMDSSGSRIVSWAGGLSPSLTPPVSSGWHRFDVLVLRDDGTLDFVTGTQVPLATPTPPVPQFNGCSPIARIYVTETAVILISDSDLTDYRALFTPGSGWKILSPDAGTIQAQLSDLGMAAGDRFWLLPGNYSLGGSSVDFNVDNVLVAGTFGSKIKMTVAAENIDVSGNNVTLRGFAVEHFVPPTSTYIVGCSSTGCVVENLCIDYTNTGGSSSATFGFRLAGDFNTIRNLSINWYVSTSYSCRGLHVLGPRNQIHGLRVLCPEGGLVIASQESEYTNILVETDGTTGGPTYFAVILSSSADRSHITNMSIRSFTVSSLTINSGATQCFIHNLYIGGSTTASSTYKTMLIEGSFNVISNFYADRRPIVLRGEGNVLADGICDVNEDGTTTPTVAVGGQGLHLITGCRLTRQQAIAVPNAHVISIYGSDEPGAVRILGNRFISDGYGACVVGDFFCNNWIVKDNHGIAGGPAGPGWQQSTAYSLGAWVAPNFFKIAVIGSGGDYQCGYMARCTTAGTSAAGEPNWAYGVGSTINDGTVQWTMEAMPGGVCPSGGSGWQTDYGAHPIIGWLDGVVYHAYQDMMVHGASNGNDTVYDFGYADFKTVPDTIRVKGGNRQAADVHSGCTMMVRRGENWKIDFIPSGSLAYTITVIPWE